MRRYEIGDVNWERISPLLPGKEGDGGRSAEDNRQFINGVLWIARSGAPGGIYQSPMAIGILFFSFFSGGLKRESGNKYLMPYKSLIGIGCLLIQLW